MRSLVLWVILFAFSIATAQDKHSHSYVCKNGKIHFFSSAPLENIEATSQSAVSVLNTETKKVYCKVNNTTFKFRHKLMEEHFNENYVESEKYPYGILDAVIKEDIDFTKDGVYDVTLHGTFEIHGVKQERDIKGQLTIKNGQPYMATAKFDVRLADHKIAIPKAVIANIAEVIAIDVEFYFEKYQAK